MSLPANASAAQLVLEIIDRSCRRGLGVMGGFPGDVLSVWLGERVEMWFAGENDHMFTWDIAVPEHLVPALLERIPGLQFRAINARDLHVYRVARAK